MKQNLNRTDRIYHELVDEVLNDGIPKGDRTGTGTIAVVGRMAHFDLMNGRNPRLTTKPIIGMNPEEEMFWFISGDTNIKMLRDKNIGIWNSWLIPGTEVFEDLELEAILKKLPAETVKELTMATVDYALNISGDVSSAYRDDLEQLTARIRDGSIAKEVKAIINAGLDAFIRLWLTEQKIPTKRLVSGDIGKGGYGAQWRFWQDTQIIDQSEFDDYKAQGYNRITTIQTEHASYEYSGKLVVHRTIDQLANAINLLKNNPDSRRIIVSAWNPALIWKAALPPCHLYFQFISHEMTVEQRAKILTDRVMLGKRDIELETERTGRQDLALRTWIDFDLQRVRNHGSTDEEIHVMLDGYDVHRRNLNCFLLLRSNDLGLGMPFNVSQYAALTHMVAQVVDMAPGELVWAAVDAHVYNDHIKGLQEQLERDSVDCCPRIKLDKKVKCIDDFDGSKIEIIDYKSQPPLINKMLPSV